MCRAYASRIAKANVWCAVFKMESPATRRGFPQLINRVLAALTLLAGLLLPALLLTALLLLTRLLLAALLSALLLATLLLATLLLLTTLLLAGLLVWILIHRSFLSNVGSKR